MFKSKVLVLLVLVCYVLFAAFEFSGNETIALYFHSLIVPIITILYSLTIKQKSKLFCLFLICYSLSDLLVIIIDTLITENSQEIYDFRYYAGNLLYIMAYTFLILKIGRSINFMHVVKFFKVHVFVLTVLNIYFLYVLHIIINPNLSFESDYYIELVYNVVVVSLLSIALLNYFYKDNKKSFYLFLGALCIVFSEVMDIAYIFVAKRDILNFLSTTIGLAGFYFFYQQSKLLNTSNDEDVYAYTD